MKGSGLPKTLISFLQFVLGSYFISLNPSNLDPQKVVTRIKS